MNGFINVLKLFIFEIRAMFYLTKIIIGYEIIHT